MQMSNASLVNTRAANRFGGTPNRAAKPKSALGQVSPSARLYACVLLRPVTRRKGRAVSPESDIANVPQSRTGAPSVHLVTYRGQTQLGVPQPLGVSTC